ncbi:MAG: hypothetical protein GF315_14965, partial [candidate division Zixibacteria bacterium]|nr:hypothetical protein [candidate division Zixibacteria bacterium]
ALEDLQTASGITLVEDSEPVVPLFSTSSAGGGLAMVIMGLVREVTTQSAERVALGAGSLVLDYIALDDGRTPYKKIQALKNLRPDMILLAGGFDGGSVFGPVFLAELLSQANLQPKLTQLSKVPVIYAGNVDAREFVKETLGDRFSYFETPNIRPQSMEENLEPARKTIHDLFMDHVMSHAPGYEKYQSWVSGSLIPTPAGMSKILEVISEDSGKKVLAIDIGGATTDIFTASEGKVFRTVSANLGMSYSILNVAKIVGLENITTLLDFDIENVELLNRIGNKYLNPTSLPDNETDAEIECAVASNAIRQAVIDHFRVKEGLSLSRHGEELSFSTLSRKKRKEDISTQLESQLSDYELIIGSGGILSHTPRDTAAKILINGLKLNDTVELAVDSMFILPHLGVLSTQNRELANELFYRFGIVRLGTLIAPTGELKSGKEAVEIRGKINGKQEIKEEIKAGELRFVKIEATEESKIKCKANKLKLRSKKLTVDENVPQLIVDVRGRPFHSSNVKYLPDDHKPPTRRIETRQEEIIHKGEIAVDRRLAIPGEVLVKPGETVTADQVVAKSVRQFLRPFFLDIASKLNIQPEELTEYLNKQVGDEIELDEPIAERKTPIRNYVFRSPVAGTVEKILSNGTIIVREKPETSGSLASVKVAQDLNIEADEIEPYLKVKPGDEVEKGQHLAEILNPSRSVGIRFSKSPLRGKVKSINLEYGLVIIETLIEELELTAWMPGTVSEISDKGCVIVNNGISIQGKWGHGGEVFGKLAVEEVDADCIVVMNEVSGKTLSRLNDAAVKGLITGGLNLKDVEELQPGYPIVVTEKFGADRISEPIYDILKSSDGKLTMIDGATQLRVGVKRPRIIVPNGE